MDRLEPSVALGPGDDPAEQQLGVRREPGVGIGPTDVRDREHVAAERDEVRGRAVGAPPRGEHDRARADEHPVLEVQRRGVAQHHAGPVVVGERDRTLERAGREDHAPRADVPDPVEFVRVLEHGDVPVVVQAERRRAREVRDALGPEVPTGAPLDRPMLLDEHHAFPTRGGVAGRVEAVVPAPHDEQLDVRVPVLDGAAGRRVAAEASDARTAPDHHAVDDVHHGRRDDRLEPRLRDLDERVRLLGARREDAARAPEDRAAERGLDPVREDRARDRVAHERRDLLAVERERDRLGAVDRRPTRGVRRAVTGRPRPEGSTARTRTSPCREPRSNHRRHPATWYQRSANAPLGLSRMNRKSAHASSLRASGSEGYAIPAWPP